MAWFDDFFDDSYLKTYTHLNWERTSRDADLITHLLGLTPELDILDIPCGFGRHSIELTKRGYKVTGVEYSQTQIDFAERLMVEHNAPFEIIHADMRFLNIDKKFDILFNYFTSFGYFSDEENEKTLLNFFTVLKPGGRILLDIGNRDAILKQFQPACVTRLEDGTMFVEERKYDPLTGRMSAVHTIVSPDGRITERMLDHRSYTAYELIAMFKSAGFEILNVYGDGDQPLQTFSRRICIVARKPE
ncbi:MAG: class I SAM-dependent methyltransferase [Firmicutes bacterium]|nr:class I SAM-dependent methyltransferase [Bacillota bacterium]